MTTNIAIQNNGRGLSSLISAMHKPNRHDRAEIGFLKVKKTFVYV